MSYCLCQPTHLNLCSPSIKRTGKTKFKRADVETATDLSLLLLLMVVVVVVFVGIEHHPHTWNFAHPVQNVKEREGKISSWQMTLFLRSLTPLLMSPLPSPSSPPETTRKKKRFQLKRSTKNNPSREAEKN